MGKLLALFFFVAFSASAQGVHHPKNYVLCKLGKSVRSIRVQVDEQKVCQTIYNKHGADQMIGSGRNYDSCVKFLDNVKTNLEKSNWRCRDVESVTVVSE